jgi:acyl carrier protein
MTATASKRVETQETAIVAIVEDLIQDWGLDFSGGVQGSTRLVEELQFASVDIIQLCVALEQHYGRKLGFQDLLMVDGSYVPDLAISQVARFVEARLAQPSEQS